MNRNLFLFLFLSSAVSLFLSTKVEAASNPSVTNSPSTMNGNPSYLIASNMTSPTSYRLMASEEDETYDPFSDYNEFDENSDEEADINFFRNGRFLTVGLVVGMRGFTDNLNELYSTGPTYGIFLSYFFDLRLALQFGFNTGDHGFEIRTKDTPQKILTGNVSITQMHLAMKYYFNTQNVTKGLADLNPYILGGFSQVYRTTTLSGTEGFGRESTMGLDGGVGLEIPLMRRKAYFGIQATYHSINFKDENSPIVLPDGTNTNVAPSGDAYDVLGIIGLNF